MNFLVVFIAQPSRLVPDSIGTIDCTVHAVELLLRVLGRISNWRTSGLKTKTYLDFVIRIFALTLTLKDVPLRLFKPHELLP